jgi:hypothetical protein
MLALMYRRGGDGKSYPAHPLSEAERLRIARLVHQLRCTDGLPVRRVRAALAAAGITRSAGSVVADLHRWRCVHCSSPGGAPLPPEPRSGDVPRCT